MSQIWDGVAISIIAMIFLAVITGVLAVVLSFKCERRWAHSGLESSWGLVQGCLVKLPDGRWLPQENIREIDLAPKKD